MTCLQTNPAVILNLNAFKTANSLTKLTTKPDVADIAALPLTGNSVGDVRGTIDEQLWFAWDGTTWQDMGSGLAYQVVKVSFGDGADLTQVSATNPLPVTGTFSVSVGSVTVTSGNITVTNLPPVVDALNPLPVTFPGGVTVSNFPAVQPVSGTVNVGNFPAIQAVNTSNITTDFSDSFESYTPGVDWNQTLATGDLIFADGNAAGSSYLVISKNPLLADTESSVVSIPTFTLPVEMPVGLSMSQRTLGQEFFVELADTAAPIPTPPDIAIDTIIQATTTLTVTTTVPHGLSVGRSIGICGVLDSRLNYPALVVATVPSPTQFTVTAGPGGTIVSQSAYTSSVLAATTAPLPANAYANGTAGVGATLTASVNGAFPAQDGVTIPLNGRVLVKNEATAANNGIYTLTQVGSGSLPWILTRATDFDTAAEMTVVAGALFAVSAYVTGGATQAQQEYYLAATVTTVGTTAVTFTYSGYTGPLGGVFDRPRMGRARNGISQVFENVTVTNASLYSRAGGGDVVPSGTVAGNQSVTIGTTASVQLAGNTPYTYSFFPTTEYRFLAQQDRVQWVDAAVDAVAQTTSRLLRTQVCPDAYATYSTRFRAINNKSLTVPNAQIVSAVKTGTTTATITTDVAHGLLPGDLVTVYGIRDQGASSFPNLATATAVATTPTTTSFTIVIGTAGTVTSYGGYVARVQAGNLPSALGAVAQVAQSATLTTLVDGTRQLTLVGSASWAAPATIIGDMLELVGCRDNTTGATLNIDGPWKIANVVTTALTLVLPFTAQRVLPADFPVTNCGGALIKRTCLRINSVRLFDYTRERVELLARPANDMSAAAPVVVQGGTLPTVTTVGTVTTVTTVTTVGSVSNVAAIGAYPAQMQIFDQNKVSWASTVRNLIT